MFLISTGSLEFLPKFNQYHNCFAKSHFHGTCNNQKSATEHNAWPTSWDVNNYILQVDMYICNKL